MSNDPSNPNAPPPADPTAAPPAAQPPMPPTAQPAMPSFAQPMPAMQPPFAQPAMPPFAQPMAPQYPHAPMQAPFAQPAMQPPFAQPPMPSFAQPMMPVAQPVMPVAQPVMPVAQPVMAPPVTAANGPVIGLKDQYRFAEEAVAQKAQVSILESPKVPPELPSPSRIDPNFEQLKIALEAQLARNAIAPMMYAPPNATRWFRFSPYELFLEQVLARKLWTLE